MVGDEDWIEDIRGVPDGPFFFHLESPVAESWISGSTQCSNTRIFTMGSRLRGRDLERGQRESDWGVPMEDEKGNLYDRPDQFCSSKSFRGPFAELCYQGAYADWNTRRPLIGTGFRAKFEW